MFDKYTDCIKLGKKIRFEVDIRMLQRDRWIKSVGKNVTYGKMGICPFLQEK